jgi:hypothetical protein
MTEEVVQENNDLANNLKNALNEALGKPEVVIEEKEEIVVNEEEVVEQETQDNNDALEVSEKEQSEEVNQIEEEFKLIPKEWKKEEKEKFEAVLNNPETKEAAEVLISRYENLRKDYHRKAGERAEFAKQVSSWDEIFDDRAKEALKARGIEAPEYVKRLLSVEQSLITNPAPTIKKLMEAYRVDPKQFVNDESNDEVVDYDKTITELKKDVAQIKQGNVQKETNIAARQDAEIAKQIRDFKFAIDESGEPKHPLFEEAYDEMSSLIVKGKAKTLEEAYEMSPTVQLTKMQAEAERQKKVDLEEEKRKVAKAKKAAKGITNTRVVKPAPEKLSFEEMFRRNLREASANS